MKTGFVSVGRASDLPEGGLMSAEVGGHSVLVAPVRGEFYAIGEERSHVGGPLADGKLYGCEIERPWHGGRFDLRTGEATAPPPGTAAPRFEVRIEGDRIMVGPA